MSIIEVKNVKKYFQQGDYTIHAVDDISFQVEKGEFTALVGPSGSGKTTLLNAVGALDRPDSGKIILDEKDLSELNENELTDFRLYNVGFVFQAYNLIPVLTAYENVDYILMLQDVNDKERKERVRDIFARMDMEDLLDRFPAQLSGGQQQRVAVARALVTGPSVVLADEPTANLDSKTAEMLLDLMAKMCTEMQTTFLFSTHDDRVMQRARRLIKMRDGKLETDEPGPGQ